jgi:hypothetical protein
MFRADTTSDDPFHRGQSFMTSLVIQLTVGGVPDVCTLCGGPATAAGGLGLFLADSQDCVCRTCGKRHAPSLAALLDLAGTAERVGRIGRHTVFPPLGALLDLARAAEAYTCSTSPRRRQTAA